MLAVPTLQFRHPLTFLILVKSHNFAQQFRSISHPAIRYHESAQLMRNGDSAMPRNDEGDFILTLGNKELISVFVVGIILLGVFFAMGYALGRTNGTQTAETRKPDYVRTDPPSSMSAPPARTITPPAAEATPAPTEAAPTPVPAAAPTETSAAAKPAETAGAPTVIVPAPGQAFLQVAAVAKPDAEMVQQVLKGKGFAASLAAGPPERPEIMRVLVGPAADNAEISRLKADLEKAGFKSFVKKY